MDKNKWIVNFENQMYNFSKFDKNIMNVLIGYLENDKDLDLNDEQLSKLRFYLLGDEIDSESYKIFRRQIFQRKLKLDTRNIDDEDIRFEVNKKLLGLLYDNFSAIEKLDFETLCNFLIRQLILFKEKTVTLSTSFDTEFNNSNDEWMVSAKSVVSNLDLEENENIKIMNITDPDIILETEYGALEIDAKTKFNITRDKDKEVINFYFMYGRDKKFLWSDFEERAKVSCNIKYIEFKFSWEEILAESFRFFNNGRFEMAFLQLFTCFDAIVEFCISIAKNMLFEELKDKRYRTEKNWIYLIEGFSTKLLDVDKDFKFLLDLYRSMNIDNRKLISQKFSDVMIFNDYFNGRKRDIWSDNGRLLKVRNSLNDLVDLRNGLAHGNYNRDANYETKYVRLLFDLFIVMSELKFYDL